MNRNTRKPQTADEPDAVRPDAASPRRREPPVMNNNTGRVRHDERGNAIWEWAVSTGSMAVDAATQRITKLDNPALSLADDASPFDAVKNNPSGTVKGYSPYDSGLLDKKHKSRKKDLRRLSEWMKLKQQAANRKPDDE